MQKRLYLALIIPIIFFIYALYSLGNYGINWDEPYHFRRGQAFLQHFLTGKKTYEGIPKYPPLKGTADSANFRESEKHSEEVQNNPTLSDSNYRRSYYQDDDWNGEYHIDMEDPYGHPSLNDILAAFFNKIFYQKLGILGDLESYHLFEITTTSFLVFVVAIFMYKEFGLVESVISSLTLTTYPLFLGEQHFNIKDPIVASFYALTLIFFYLGFKNKKLFLLILSIFFFAFGLSTKFNIAFIALPIIIWTICYCYKNKETKNIIKKLWPVFLIGPIIVLAIFIFSFPTIWKNPIWGIGRIISYYTTEGYSELSQPENYYKFGFFNTYPIIWIFYTTPIPTILLSILPLVFIRKTFQKGSFSLLLSLSLPTIILRISIFGALSYGGVRLIMEYIPVLAMLCGIGSGFLYKKIKKIPLYLFLAIVLLAYSPTIIKLIKIHPNENIFFNVIAGGLSGAKEKQVNSWGNSNGNAYFPAITWLNENAEENARLTIPVGSISNIPRFKLRKDIASSDTYWSGPEHKGEYVLELTYDCPQKQWYSLKYLNTAMKPVYENKVDGVAIAKLWKNSPEYVLPEFKKQKEISTTNLIKTDNNLLEIVLPQNEKIMEIELSQPTKNCDTLVTGYIDTSTDFRTWAREVEDIARDQLRHSKLKELEPIFNFYFVAREAKSIRIHTDNPNSCILKSTEAKITVLENN